MATPQHVQPVPMRTLSADADAGPHVMASEYIAKAGPWHFTRQAVVDELQTRQLYQLYRQAFDPLRTTSAARQVLTRTEFEAIMADGRVDKYLARTDAGETVGLTTLTRRLESVPWISPEYYAARYPDYWARDALYYLGFVLTRPDLRHSRFLETVVELGMAKLTRERAMVAYDVCAFNHDVLRFSTRIAELLATDPRAHLEQADRQIYFAATFG